MLQASKARAAPRMSPIARRWVRPLAKGSPKAHRPFLGRDPPRLDAGHRLQLGKEPHTSGHDSHPTILFSPFTSHVSRFTFQMRCDPGLNSSLMMADEKFHQTPSCCQFAGKTFPLKLQLPHLLTSILLNVGYAVIGWNLVSLGSRSLNHARSYVLPSPPTPTPFVLAHNTGRSRHRPAASHSPKTTASPETFIRSLGSEPSFSDCEQSAQQFNFISHMNVQTYIQYPTMTVPLVRCSALPMFEGTHSSSPPNWRPLRSNSPSFKRIHVRETELSMI